MKQKGFRKKTICSFAVMVSAVLFTLAAMRLLSVYDNKYTKKASVSQDNIVTLPESGCCFLADGWEIYPDRLLSPTDFAPDSLPSPRYLTWAGEYPNLAAFHTDGNPYGSATYRLSLNGTGTVSLYLPEPLCAAHVFVNAQDLGGPGEVQPDQYSPLIRDTVYSFSASGNTELIIQISNYSHYYGGLWYPPAIGDPDSISHLIAYRMLFYGLLFFSSLTLSLFCLVFLKKNKLKQPAFFDFGMLCLTFCLRICYPFIRLAGIPLVRSLYALEDVMALAGLFFALQIALRLFLPQKHHKLHTIVRIFALGMCGVSILVPLVLLPAFPALTQWYGIMISWYKIAAAVFLTASTFYGCLTDRPHIRIPLAATAANGTFLLYGVLAVGHFEPAALGWPEEYGVYCMVIAFAIQMIQQNHDIITENNRLTFHLQEEVEEKTLYLHQLLAERGELITELGHDMKSPLTSLSNMAQIIRSNDIMLDPNTRDKMSYIEEQCGLLSQRLQSIQMLASETGTPSHMESLNLNQFLSDFHYSSRPVIEMSGPDFIYQCSPQPCQILADTQKLSRALENLVYNAAEHTPADGRITLALTAEDSYACIDISDTGCGIPEKELPNIFRRFYTTNRENGGQGLGLPIAKAIITEHGGEIHVTSVEGRGTTFTIRIPLRKTNQHDSQRI